ncbi:MAG: ABC transporter ATP-binding protein/permease [Oscillospiraceae bacterium]|jgi:ATP-binding cassette subfamily B protein|nr:ABC transporter ATP-binding protein/permease [Oscillospiraceae bacterium]
MKEKDNKQSVKTVAGNNLFLLKLAFRTSPLYVLCFIFEHIRNQVMIFLEFTIALNFVLECVEFGRPFRDAAVFLTVLLVVVVLGLLYNSFFYQRIKEKAVPKINMALKEQLYGKAREIDLENYDDPDFYNEYILAVSESDKQVERIFTLLEKITVGVTSFVCTSGYFIAKDPMSFLFVAGSFVSTFFVSKQIGRLNFFIRTEKNPHERKWGYTNRIFYLNDYAKEVRLNTEVSEVFLKDFDATGDELLAIEKKVSKKRVWLDFLKGYITNDFIIDVFYLAYLVYNAAVLRRITFSNVAVMRWAANWMKQNTRVISESYPYAQETSLYVEKILAFLRTQPDVVSISDLEPPGGPAVIELKDVSFRYSEDGGYVLKHINMTINPLSKIAIVGYNGAGKTTLIKLIMRLYDPVEGVILLNGIDIREYALEDYRRKIGAVFQDYKIFAATVKENVLLDFEERGSDSAVLTALDKGGFSERLATLPSGLHTNLTTEFEEDGVNLSGGEGQKLAVSRVFYPGAGMIILDEPSSAFDPIAEYHLNSAILTATENKSVLFISHRLSTTRIADRIYMLEDGEIIEQGSHAELLDSGGKYAEMWRIQAGNY